ncbi:hypothetical protein OS493_009873 [Desmophyllum pertusum]|uniref:Uncharacterized protein n=1 Tax=Desmophyllum pertusum TaxID=174260 RepID=A0A9W9YRM8_9CNID|nr:hypothetical protein OS493_009873 [Desmophyllum pertusum]
MFNDDFGEIRVELDESSPPVKDDRKQLEDRDTTCGLHCGSSSAVPEGMDQNTWDNVDGAMYHRVKKTIYWVSVMDGLQRVLIFADDENLSSLARKVGKRSVYARLQRNSYSNDEISAVLT